MGNTKLFHILLISFLVVLATTPSAYGWGADAHTAICRIAQARLTRAALAVVRRLLPASANGDLGVVCSWADTIKSQFPWSSPYHFINTPDLCTYSYTRDCKAINGVADSCLAGAINNYTTQLTNYRKRGQTYNLTESLMYLSHFMGDIHQPLHVGFISDRGGNTISVKWFLKKSNLHRVWDTDMVVKNQGRAPNATNVFASSIIAKLNTQWAKQATGWAACKGACADLYAQESIKAACNYAYKGVLNNTALSGGRGRSTLSHVDISGVHFNINPSESNLCHYAMASCGNANSSSRGSPCSISQ